MQRIFKNFDKKNKGKFDFEDYVVISKTVKEELSMEELKEAFDFMDIDGDGFVGCLLYTSRCV